MLQPLSKLSTEELLHLKQSLLNSPCGKEPSSTESTLFQALGIPSQTDLDLIQNPLSPSELKDKAAAEASLYEFLRQAWHVIEPGVDFVEGWHLRVICAHVQAMAAGKIVNLLITCPPETGKSIILDVCLPAWVWASEPQRRFIHFSYGAELSIRDSVKCRSVISSRWYRRLWGDIYKLTGDQNQKTYFTNDATGYRLSSSVGGRGTGEHPDFIVVNDPLKADDAWSKAVREEVNSWWDGTISTRGKMRGIRRVVCAQRLHADDLPGHILTSNASAWDHVKLPMRAEPSKRPRPTKIGWFDNRKEGEILWPQGKPEAAVREQEKELGPLRTPAQLQQDPLAAAGKLFKREWLLKAIEMAGNRKPPRNIPRMRFWDLAATETASADFTAGILMSIEPDETVWIEDLARGQWEPGTRDVNIKSQAQVDGANVFVRIEEEGGASGKSVVFNYQRMLRGYRVSGDKPGQNKMLRANPFAGWLQNGLVRICRAEWNNELIQELEAFPDGAHDDIVDACSGAFNSLSKVSEWWGSVNGALVASGEDDEDRKPFTEQEQEELPDDLAELITETQAIAKERRPDKFDRDDW